MCCAGTTFGVGKVVLIQTLGQVAVQVFAIALDRIFQLTITLLILGAGGLALAHCHPFEQEGPQLVQGCIVMLQAGPGWMSHSYVCATRNTAQAWHYTVHSGPTNAWLTWSDPVMQSKSHDADCYAYHAMSTQQSLQHGKQHLLLCPHVQ